MAFGGRHGSRAVRVLWVLGLSLCALFASPALAQQGNGEAGRVPIYGVPSKLQDDLKQLQREEPAPTTLFEARRQAERAASLVATFLESQGYYQAEVEPTAEGVDTFTRAVIVTSGPLFIYSAATIDYLDSQPDDTTRAELEFAAREARSWYPRSRPARDRNRRRADRAPAQRRLSGCEAGSRRCARRCADRLSRTDLQDPPRPPRLIRQALRLGPRRHQA